MGVVTFIGDELIATGFRLAGADVIIVSPDGAGEALQTARDSAALVLLAATHAGGVATAGLEQALLAARPLTLIVDDILGREAPPDMEQMMRRALGVEVS